MQIFYRPTSVNKVLKWINDRVLIIVAIYWASSLKRNLLNECYIHCICLHVAFRILLFPIILKKMVNFSEKILIRFVEKLYKGQFVSHNIYGLIHIADNYVKFGSLEKRILSF